MGKASNAAAIALPLAGAAAGGAMGGPAGAAAGFSIGSSVSGTMTSMQANNDAIKQQKKMLDEELRQAKQVAAIEDRQLAGSINLADAQAVERVLMADRQTVAGLQLEDSQAVEVLLEEDRQNAQAAEEDKLAIESNRKTEELNAALTSKAIGRQLDETLGEQRATMAARGVLNGATGEAFRKEAEADAAQDAAVNEINRLQANADAEAGVRQVEQGLANSRSSAAIEVKQRREAAAQTLSNQREAAAVGISQQRATAAQELANVREKTVVDLENQERSAKIGYKSAKQQTQYANQAAIVAGFADVAGTAYDVYSKYKGIEPSSRTTAKPTASRGLARFNNVF